MIIYSGVTASNNSSDTTAYLLTNATDCLIVVFNNTGQLLSVKSENKRQILKENWESIQFGSNTTSFTILPNISNENIPNEEIATFLHWKNEGTIFKNSLQFDHNTLIFKDDLVGLQLQFPAMNVAHICEWVINYSQKQTWQNGITCVTYFNQTVICVIKEQKLMLCNIFAVANNDELLYYIMLMIQEQSLSQEDTVIHLYGECDKTPQLKSNLDNFVRHIETFAQSEITDASVSGVVKFLAQLS